MTRQKRRDRPVRFQTKALLQDTLHHLHRQEIRTVNLMFHEDVNHCMSIRRLACRMLRFDLFSTWRIQSHGTLPRQRAA